MKTVQPWSDKSPPISLVWTSFPNPKLSPRLGESTQGRLFLFSMSLAQEDED